MGWKQKLLIASILLPIYLMQISVRLLRGNLPNFDSKLFAVSGNDWDIKAYGIPMSNKQEVTIGSDGQPNVKDLYVVRMLSKITLKFRNMTSGNITVNSVSIS